VILAYFGRAGAEPDSGYRDLAGSIRSFSSGSHSLLMASREYERSPPLARDQIASYGKVTI
jgi:hypothetical protein